MDRPVSPPTQDDIARILGADRPRARARRLWLAAAGALVLVLALGAAAAYFLLAGGDDGAAARYVTEEARRGNLVASVSATGRLQPTNQVDVGSELSGTISQVLVDENDRVRKGDVLAALDLSRLQDQVAKSRAALAAARAQLAQMQATEAEARANLQRLRQVAELSGGKVPSRAEMETGEAAVKRAVANAANARASIAQAEAQLKSDATNLSKASIRSPINGVVLTRKVEPGQTVAASLQAPVLFTIAEDLAQMTLEVDVDEADVGRVGEGQGATFNVDAYPERRYPSKVVRVGYGAQTKDNVVSYLTVLSVDNADLSLRPGMTGTAEIVTTRRENVLLVPNAALRFAPAPPPGAQKSGAGSFLTRMMPRPPRQAQRAPQPSAKGAAQRVWVLREGRPAPVAVKVGATDGRLTEVTGGELREGTQVITEMLSAPQ
jgi:HlyD family secretion protein